MLSSPQRLARCAFVGHTSMGAETMCVAGLAIFRNPPMRVVIEIPSCVHCRREAVNCKISRLGGVGRPTPSVVGRFDDVTLAAVRVLKVPGAADNVGTLLTCKISCLLGAVRDAATFLGCCARLEY